MLFSERYGYKPKKPLQLGCMDDDLKMAIHNAIVEFEKSNRIEYNNLLYLRIWRDFYIQDANDYYNGQFHTITQGCEEKFQKLAWYKVYDFVEFYLKVIEQPELSISFIVSKNELINELNTVFEKYNSAYRFVNGKIAPITNEQEIAEIEEAANTGKKAIDYHLNRAIEIFANREKKDYVNTIKEAISAVEATVNLINKTEGKTLGDALKELNNNNKIHPALCEAFSKIYGYTSDKNTGIRHSIFDGTNCIPDFTDTKYMLVACSAFINYLLAKAGD